MKYTKSYKGQFFPLGDSKNSIFGLLKFLNGVAYIDLFGHFPASNNNPIGTPVIYGILDNGHSCIFFDCRLTKPNPFLISSLVNFRHFIHAPSHLLNNSEQKLEFDQASFRLDYLTLWTGFDVFTPVVKDNKVTGVNRKLDNIYEVKLLEDENYELVVTHSHTVPIINPYPEYKLEQESWLNLKFKYQTDFKDMFSLLLEVEELFVLMIGKQVRITTPIALYKSKENSYECYLNSIDIKLEPITHQHLAPVSIEPIIDLNTLLKRTTTQEFFHGWKKLRSTFEYSTSKIIESIRGKNTNHESNFLNLVFALEKLIETDMPQQSKVRELTENDKKHLQKLKEEGVQENTINYISSRIKKVNRVTLKERVLAYLIDYKEDIDQIVISDFETFINILVDSRNNLAHLCDNCLYQMKPAEYVNFNKQLLAILITLLYSKIGISSDFAVKALKFNSQFKIQV